MSASCASPKPAPTLSLTEAQVLNYLKSNPDFLTHHGETLGVAAPTETVVNMETYQLKKTQDKLDRLEETNRRLMQAARHNAESEAKLRALGLKLLRAESLTELRTVLEGALKTEMALHSVRLTLRGEGAGKMAEADLLSPFEESCEPVALRALYEDSDRRFHGAGAEQLHSDALLLLEMDGETLGVLAFGSTEKTRFHAGQGAELLTFFGALVAHCVARLDREPADATDAQTTAS